MANPTTNYGFVLPTSTDLVTDLPADFDVALQGVDTRLKALQPGTTLGDLAYSSATANTNTRLPIGTNGQVLAVVGGVPAWQNGTTGDIEGVTAGVGISGGGTSGTVTVTNSMATAITTNGDLIYGTGSGTFTRRGIGSTGDVLTVSGGVPTWATPAAGGGMTSIASGSLSGSSVSLTSISGSYKNLVLIIRNFRPSDDGAELCSTVNSVTTNYGKSASITEINVNATSNSWLQFARRQDNSQANGLMQFEFIDYANATTWKMVDAFAMTQDSVDTTQWNIQRSSFVTRQTAAISSIQLFPDTGTFTSGTYILYGVN